MDWVLIKCVAGNFTVTTKHRMYGRWLSALSLLLLLLLLLYSWPQKKSFRSRQAQTLLTLPASHHTRHTKKRWLTERQQRRRTQRWSWKPSRPWSGRSLWRRTISSILDWVNQVCEWMWGAIIERVLGVCLVFVLIAECLVCLLYTSPSPRDRG